MTVYVALLRGINVGGRNKVPMAELRSVLTDLGLSSVSTYIASGNAVFGSGDDATVLAERIETALPTRFKLDSSIIRVLILDADKYRYDVAFLLGIDAEEARAAMPVNPDVDATWAGPGAVYYRRLTELATKSRLSKVMSTPLYAKMTIRNWNTTVKLAALVDKVTP